VTPDGKTWTFNLRHGVRWSDGRPLTADDVVFTWNEVMYNPNYNKVSYDLFRIHGTNFGVSKTDDFTVRVATPEVFAPFLEYFGGMAILPQHTLATAVSTRRFVQAYPTDAPPGWIVGCGPYRLKEFQQDKYTLLERNPEYWVADREGRRLPYFDEVMLTPHASGDGVLQAFLDGKSDVVDGVRVEHIARLKQASAQGRFRVVEMGPGTEREFLWFNQNTGADTNGRPFVNPAKLKWFRNRKFRQAVSCAIDRAQLARDVFGGAAQPMDGLVATENQKWNNPNIPHWAYDPAKARALLAEIGIADRKGTGVAEDAEGNTVEMVFNSNTGNPLREKSALLIAEDLRKVGIKLDYAPVDFETLKQKVTGTFDYECAMMGLGGGGGDPASQIDVLRSSEELHQWCPSQRTPGTEWEARIDALMDAQMRTLDFAQRKKAFDEVQVILADELPMIYTVAAPACGAVRSDVGNLRPAVLAVYHLTWNLEELYFKGQ
jgi:peptide/nickel transport system substrate-binding protein